MGRKKSIYNVERSKTKMSHNINQTRETKNQLNGADAFMKLLPIPSLSLSSDTSDSEASSSDSLSESSVCLFWGERKFWRRQNREKMGLR